MTVTGEAAAQPGYDWDDLAVVVNLAAGLMRTQAANAATTNSMWAGGAPRLQLHAASWDELAAVVDLAARTAPERTTPMTVTAAKPQVRAGTGSTPAKAVGARRANSVPPATAAPSPPRRRGFTPLTPMRQQAAKCMRKLAQQVQEAHPDLAVHQHVRDAARMLESGNEEAAQRHLRAAMFSLTPQSLHRQGVHDDVGHIAARHAVHGVHRHLLLVKDIADVGEKNRAAIRRDSYGDLESAPSLPSSPVHADPNAGYGPGALARSRWRGSRAEPGFERPGADE